MADDESMRRLMRANALQPRDDAFTRGVLSALPPRRYFGASTRRSFAATTRFAAAIALLAFAHYWYLSGPGGLETMLILLLALGPAFMAASLLFGPLIPRSVQRLMWRGGREWR